MDNLKMLSCNVRKDVPNDSLSGNGWDHRKELCAEVIGAQSADVICFQESSSVHLDYLKARLPGFEVFGLANPGAELHQGNAIFFSRDRFELLTAGGFWLSETPHVAGSKSWNSKGARFANWVALRERRSREGCLIWNTHFDHISQDAREQQARLVVEASEVFPDVPQLLALDANADAANPAIEIIKSGGWLDTYGAVHGPEDPGFTFHAFLGPTIIEERPSEKIKGKIDWIFCRGPVEVLAAEIIRDCRDGLYPSDHYFVSAEVTYHHR